MFCATPNRWLFVLALWLPTLAACSKDPCFPVSKGRQYRINVVELWDASSRFPGGNSSNPCPVGFDLKAGGSFVVQVDSFSATGSACSCGLGAAVEAPDGWAWVRAGDDECEGNFFQLRTNAMDGACSGKVQVSIESSRVPTGSAVPGQPPVAHLQRTFQPITADCGSRGSVCTDAFVIEIEEL